MRVSDEGKSSTIQWERIKVSPVAPEPWLRLFSIYMEEGLRFPAIYVARRLRLIDPALGDHIDKQGLSGWESEGAEYSVLLEAVAEKNTTTRDKVSAWLEGNPGDWLCWLYLAALNELKTGNHAQDDVLEKACSREYIEGESRHLLGVWCLKAGLVELAVEHLRRLMDILPVRHGSMMYLGISQMMLGNPVAAEKAFQRASMSNNPQFLMLLSARIYEHNYWQEAISVLKKAVALDLKNVQIRLKLAQMQADVYLLSDCKESLREVFLLDPENLTARKILAGLAGKMGDARLHLSQLEGVHELEANQPASRIVSSIAMTMLYQDDLAPQEVADRHKSLCASLGGSAKEIDSFKNKYDNRRPLKVGYVTGDLHRQHPVCIFMLPLLRELKNANIETHIYHTGTMHDEYTHEAKKCVSRWVSAAEYDDAFLHKAIKNDQIDILLDLAGHTATHRLGVFALRSAPVQVTYLGYPHSTGLPQMDYLIGDNTVSPIEHQSLFSESLLNMPNSVFCWSPVDEYPLPIARATDLPITFGSFNNAIKLTPKTIALWSKVLKAVPGSQLLLKAPSFIDPSASGRLNMLFSDCGVDLGRVKYRGPSELSVMMAEYGDVDIALDPITYNGGTTSLQALWMGVPLITLMGQNFQSRMGASFLKALGKNNWIANDEDHFIKIAISMAGEIKSLRKGRPKLRKAIINSTLGDIKQFAKDYEGILRNAFAQS